MNTEEVGKIKYTVEIDVSALKAGTKSAEQAVKGSFNAIGSEAEKGNKRLKNSSDNAATSLVALAGSIIALRSVGNYLGGAIDSANKYQASLLGLNSVSQYFLGQTRESTEAAKALSSDGLLPLADAATGLKNLLAAGYGLEEATALMNAFKDSAAFGRQSSLSFGEAVRSATEGVKNGNSILVDNAGVTKNLSVILAEAGYSAQDLQKASTDVGVRMAILNGIIKETNSQTGDAAKLTQTAAGADARLGYQTDQLNVKVGNLANVLRKDAVNGLTNFISQNQNLIISTGSSVAAMVTFAAGAYGVSQSLKVLRTAMTLVSKHPIVAVLTLLAGILAGFVTSSLLEDVSDGMEDVGDSAGASAGGMENASEAASDLAKKLQDLDDQISKVNRDYRENLAQIVQDHETSIKDLTKQIQNENANYNAAIQERITAFQKEQGLEQAEHTKKTQALQTQIDFLRKYNNASNQQKLSELQFALAQENAQYEKQSGERQAAFDATAEAERLSYEQRLAENQTKLDAETAILNKHAEDVAGIRDVILLDEIDSLKRSRDEQLKSLNQQKIDAVSSNKSAGSAAGQAFNDEFKKWMDNVKAEASNAGTDAGKSFTTKLGDALRLSVENPKKFWEPMLKSFDNVWGLITGKMEVKNGQVVMKMSSGGGGGWATGGYTGTGGVNEVAGLVHRGEYVLPQSMVDQSTGLPKPEAISAMGGGGEMKGGDTYQITIPVSGVIVNDAQARRKLAEVIGQSLNEIMQQKGLKPAVEGL